MSEDTIDTFPASIPIRDLQEHNPEFDEKQVQRHKLIYEAGEEFKRNVDKFLVKRQIEKIGATCGVDGNSHWEARKEKAWFIPRGSGLIDFIVAAVFKNSPYLEAEPDTEGFWDGLNSNADGLGTDFSTVLRQALRQVLTFGRGYLAISFAEPETQAGEESEVRISALPADCLDDWGHDESGRLKWVRTYREDRLRSAIWRPSDTVKKCWTYVTDSEIAEYEAIFENGKQSPQLANLVRQTSHNFGSLPVYEIRASKEMFVLERIYDVLVALYNREVSITWALDNLAYAMLVLNLDTTDVDKIVISELAALRLTAVEKAGYVSPAPQIFDPLFKDCDRLKQSLYEVVQSLALNAAANQTQNARQAASAKRLDSESMKTMLQSFAWPVKDAVELLIADLKAYRGEDETEVELKNLDPGELTPEELQLQLGLQPGQELKQVPDNQEDGTQEE